MLHSVSVTYWFTNTVCVVTYFVILVPTDSLNEGYRLLQSEQSLSVNLAYLFQSKKQKNSYKLILKDILTDMYEAGFPILARSHTAFRIMS